MQKMKYMRICFFCCLVCLVLSCKKKQEAGNPSSQTILQYIAKDPSLTLMNAAIAHCKLDTIFSGGGPFTFFCPVDSAFVAAGLTQDKINAANPDSLGFLLRYNILSGRLSTTDVVGFFTEQVSSLDSAARPFVVKNYYGFFINGIPVRQDVELGDGVVQKIGQVNYPPSGTLLQLIDTLPELSIFAAVMSQEPRFQALLDTLSPGVPGFNNYPGVTVLAPTNSAFASSVYPTADSVLRSDPNILYDVFDNYFINGFQFTSDFLGGWAPNPNTARIMQLLPNAQPFAIAKDGVTILVAYGLAPPGVVNPRVIRPNIVATNGVIQEIDQVFYYHQ